MKVFISIIIAALVIFGAWLWLKRKTDNAKTPGIPPAPRDDPAVRSVIERGKRRIKDMFDIKKYK